jgi:hypothetical protein
VAGAIAWYWGKKYLDFLEERKTLFGGGGRGKTGGGSDVSTGSAGSAESGTRSGEVTRETEIAADDASAHAAALPHSGVPWATRWRAGAYTR